MQLNNKVVWQALCCGFLTGRLLLWGVSHPGRRDVGPFVHGSAADVQALGTQEAWNRDCRQIGSLTLIDKTCRACLTAVWGCMEYPSSIILNTRLSGGAKLGSTMYCGLLCAKTCVGGGISTCSHARQTWAWCTCLNKAIGVQGAANALCVHLYQPSHCVCSSAQWLGYMAGHGERSAGVMGHTCRHLQGVGATAAAVSMH